MLTFTITVNEKMIEILRFEKQFARQFPQHIKWLNTVPFEWWPELKEYAVRI